jgi:tetratricopeptide (TPR) repeat protein
MLGKQRVLGALGVLILMMTAPAWGSPNRPLRNAVASTQELSPGEPSNLDAARDLFEKASVLIKGNHYSEAVPLLRRAAALAPDQASIHHYLGYALWNPNFFIESSERRPLSSSAPIPPGEAICHLTEEYFFDSSPR